MNTMAHYSKRDVLMLIERVNQLNTEDEIGLNWSLPVGGKKLRYTNTTDWCTPQPRRLYIHKAYSASSKLFESSGCRRTSCVLFFKTLKTDGSGPVGKTEPLTLLDLRRKTSINPTKTRKHTTLIHM